MKQGKRIDITAAELAWTIGAVLLMGVLVGWALFGVPGFARTVVETGSGAEWVAAIGTWVIGYGAWRYAREAHKHRVAEAKAARTREVKSHRGRLSEMIVKVCYSTGTEKVIQDILDEPPAEQTQVALAAQIGATLKIFEDISWSDADRGCLDDVTGPLFGEYAAAMKWYVLAANNNLIGVDPRSLDEIKPHTRENLVAVLDRAKALTFATRELRGALNRARNAIA